MKFNDMNIHHHEPETSYDKKYVLQIGKKVIQRHNAVIVCDDVTVPESVVEYFINNRLWSSEKNVLQEVMDYHQETAMMAAELIPQLFAWAASGTIPEWMQSGTSTPAPDIDVIKARCTALEDFFLDSTPAALKALPKKK